MLSKICLVLGICVSLIVCGCGRKTGASLTVAGSTAFQPFAEKLAEQFMAKRPDVNITVQGGGSALGIQSARSGAAQIGMADLVELPPEARELLGVTVARDGIAIIVNPANILTNLSLEQIRGIFEGTIKNWNEVGGADHPVRVISREAGSGTRSSFETIIGGITLANAAIIQDSNGTIRETVANDRDAVGYLSHGLLNEKVKAVRTDGVECTEKEIVAGRYKLVRPVFLLIQGLPAGAVKDFIDYILSSEGQETIQMNGLLPAK
ncbi:MAG: phosphate ABC transporter substrate-binding protein [Verrucomicrobia bacterium]|nr:phosphate ABC transporter substrate-binding protein [Verrucomicrobiota bacterium]MBU4498013.1 phosphate ABC transporter substrate-binding protein [Verrucomicrobiota bacterium]